MDKTRGQLGEIEVCVAIDVTNLTVSDRGGTKGREETPERGKRLHVHVVRINLLFILSAGSIIFESHNSQERQYSASCEVTDSRGRVVLTHRWQCKEGLQLSSMEKSSMIMASIPVARACDSKFLLIHMKSLDKVMQ